jgi:uncharacterized protein
VTVGTGYARIDGRRFGPWALVTGASSGIGQEFARQLAANGLNLVLASRRRPELERVGRDLALRYDVQHRVVQVDLAHVGSVASLAEATADLDVGLVVSNAGDMVLGEFLASDPEALTAELRLNAGAHLSLTHHFGQRLAERGRGGVLLVSSMAGVQGVPYVSNYAATKAYVLTLGEGLHHEFAQRGVTVTVLVPGATDTPMITRFGADQTVMGRRLLATVDACVSDGLAALAAGRPTRISGRMNRTTIALTPRAARIRMFGAMNRSMAERAATEDSTGAPA